MTEFWNENQTQIIISVIAGIIILAVGAVTGALWEITRWLWALRSWRKPVLPSGEFPFRYAKSFAELEERIGELAPHLHGDLNIAYQPRLPPQEQEELLRLIDDTRFLVLVGRTGLGKTREGVEAIRRVEARVREPVTVLIPKAPFTPNFALPEDLSTNHIVLFVDNLHDRPFYSEGAGESAKAASGDAPAWLRQCLTYFRAYSDFRIIATARDDLHDRDYQESTRHIRPVLREFGFVEERLASWSQSNLDGLVNAVAQWRDITIPADARAELARRCGIEGTPNYAQLAVADVVRGGSLPLDQVRGLPLTFDTLWERTWDQRIAPHHARARLFEALSLIQQAGLTPYIPIVIELAARMWAGRLWWRRVRVRAALRALGPWIEVKAATLECPEAYLPRSVSFAQDGRAALVSRTLQDVLSRFRERLAPEAGKLGNFLWQYPLGSTRENLEEAIGCFRRALEVYTREAFPGNWAAVQNNLGAAYSNRIAGERAENLEEAIGRLRRALEVYTREASPREHGLVTRNLESALDELESQTNGKSG